jgi:hypothetical protein
MGLAGAGQLQLYIKPVRRPDELAAVACRREKPTKTSGSHALDVFPAFVPTGIINLLQETAYIGYNS